MMRQYRIRHKRTRQFFRMFPKYPYIYRTTRLDLAKPYCENGTYVDHVCVTPRGRSYSTKRGVLNALHEIAHLIEGTKCKGVKQCEKDERDMQWTLDTTKRWYEIVYYTSSPMKRLQYE